MTEHHEITLPDNILNPILDAGLAGLPEAISLLINHAMIIERSQHLGVGPYERDPARSGHANGFKIRRWIPAWGPWICAFRKPAIPTRRSSPARWNAASAARKP